MKITKKFAKQFDENCLKVHAKEFCDFISFPISGYDDISILTTLKDLRKEISKTATYNDKHHSMSVEEQIEFVKEFYKEFFPKSFADKAEQLLMGKDELFFNEKTGKNEVHFVKAEPGDHRSSSVSHKGDDKFLTFTVYLHGSIDDLRIIAHEVSHALSAHHRTSIKNFRLNSTFTNETFQNEATGEIESHIIEHLFNIFLYKKKIYTKKDIENYTSQQLDSLLDNLNLILEEYKVITNLDCPVSQEKLKEYTTHLENQKNQRLLDRIKIIHDRKDSADYSSYRFRYVVARIVSNNWLNRYKTSSRDEQREMIKDFVSYLSKTYQLDYEPACEELTGLSFAENVENFIQDLRNDKKLDYLT